MQLRKPFAPLRTSFGWLIAFSMLGIFLHEVGHHLFGVPSLLSLSRNWPLVAVTTSNRIAGVTGTLAGPVVNLFLGYAALLLYRFGAVGSVRSAVLYAGIANLFLVASGAVINLMVDALSGNPGNDLQLVSTLLGWNVLILPVIFTGLATPGLLHLSTQWRRGEALSIRKGAAVVFGAWLVAGLVLMALDSAFQIRFTLR